MLILIACAVGGALIGASVTWLERRIPAAAHTIIGIIAGGLLGWFIGNWFWG